MLGGNVQSGDAEARRNHGKNMEPRRQRMKRKRLGYAQSSAQGKKAQQTTTSATATESQVQGEKADNCHSGCCEITWKPPVLSR